MGDVMARIQELHTKIEEGDFTKKSRERHVARGRMLPREYVITVAEFSG